MKHTKTIAIAIVIGLLSATLTSQFASSKYPPCGLVAQGIGVSTYGCSNTAISSSPCGNELVNSESMKRCIQANYYRSKTFPFGFTQHFGASSNTIDEKPFIMNAIASFAVVTTASAVLLHSIELKKSPNKHRKSKP